MMANASQESTVFMATLDSQKKWSTTTAFFWINCLTKTFMIQFLCDWTFVSKALVCAESVVVVLPDLTNARDAIEKLSKDFLFKINIQKLQFENQRG